MPELPEVETIANGLNQRVAGDRIESVWVGSKPEPLKLSRYAGVSAAGVPKTHDVRVLGLGAGARRRNPERAERVEGSAARKITGLKMPELPEVETIANGLNQRVAGDRIASVWVGSKPEPLKLSRYAGVSAAGVPKTHDVRVLGWGAGARRRNPERAERVEGSACS